MGYSIAFSVCQPRSFRGPSSACIDDCKPQLSDRHYLSRYYSVSIITACYLSDPPLINHRNIVFHDQNVAELGICGGIGSFRLFHTAIRIRVSRCNAWDDFERVSFVYCHK
jgi:hypothetical protein